MTARRFGGGLGHLVMALSVALAPASGAVAADRDSFLAKPGVTLHDRDIDEAACTTVASAVTTPGDGASFTPGASPVTGRPDLSGANIVGTAVGGAIVGAFRAASVRRWAFGRCMRQRGYVAAKLTLSDAKAYAALNSDVDRLAWQVNFFTSARLVPAITPLVPPLPEAQPDTLSLSGFRIVPGSLQIGAAPLTDVGQVAFTTRATLLGIATLNAPLEYAPKKLFVAAGERFYQMVFRDMVEDEMVTTWCARAAQPIAINAPAPSICLTNRFEGYAVQKAVPQAGALAFGFNGIMPRDRMTQPVVLVPLPASALPGELTVNFQIVELNYMQARLIVVAVSDGQRFEGLLPTLSWDSVGRARMDVGGQTLLFATTKAGGKRVLDVKVAE